MTKSNNLSNPIFHDETAAREWLEARVWKNGRSCPHCGVVDQSTLMKGKSHRPGLYQCNACREPFTVTVNTLYERSKIPLHKWLAATHLMMASKKGMSALQVGRMLGISKKSSWFLCHRIRESLREGSFDPMGGNGKIVEMDETYYGYQKRPKRPVTAVGSAYKYEKHKPKRPIISLVERGGKVRSFHVPFADMSVVTRIVNNNLASETRLMTDESNLYGRMKDHELIASHETVKHTAGEYVRGDVHTNSVENYFLVFKRGMRGIYQHCSEKHLHRYLCEFDYRFNHREALGFSDEERMEKSVSGIVGRRLTYRRTNEARI